MIETTQVAVRLPQDLLQRIEDYRHSLPGNEMLTFSQAMRALMELGLANVEKRKRQK